jgi:hypothetical protein
MAAAGDPTDKLSLRRWSQRKLEASRGAATKEGAAAPPADAALPVNAAPPVAPAATPPTPVTVPTLPPVESLTPESDFAAFMQPKVDEALRRRALRKLFSDPRFNVMDGLDVYVDDYTQSAPVPEGLLARLQPIHDVLDGPSPREAAVAVADESAAAPTAVDIAPASVAPVPTPPPAASAAAAPDAAEAPDAPTGDRAA